MFADSAGFEFGVEGAHEAGGSDGRGFGFVIECVAHLVEEGDEGEVFVEVEFDRLQAPGQVGAAVPDDVLVDEQFGVCAAELSAAGPTPFLPLFVGEDDQAFLVVLADQHVDLPLDLAWWQDGAVPDPQTFVAGDLLQREGFVVDLDSQIRSVGVVPAEFFDEQDPEVPVVDEVE
ncbi:hypothetical protein C6369_000055 [Rhodococcus rhodochrous]|nr:hypothetical protein C6369_000055 [Rhodococcus rhodochrous]